MNIFIQTKYLQDYIKIYSNRITISKLLMKYSNEYRAHSALRLRKRCPINSET